MPHHTAFEAVHQSVIVPESFAGKRLDQVLSQLFSDYSRAQLQKWLKQGDILVNGQEKKAKDKIIGGEHITIDAKLEAQTKWLAESMDLDIIYEDEDIIVINKPAGMVVHPGAGNTTGTLSNALLAHDKAFESIPRAGIVHRLDKDTSGLMVAAKSLVAHNALVSQLSKRQVKREYEAIATGYITTGGTIKTKIGRSPHNRLKMAVTPTGKEAITHFMILERYRGHTRIRCKLETGRTHQIRVHMQHVRAPLVGDPLYNSRLKLPRGISAELDQILRDFKRQALHAYKLSFKHPVTKEIVTFEAKPPKDMQILIKALRDDANQLYQYDDMFDDFDDDFADDFDDAEDWDDFDDPDVLDSLNNRSQ
ncbi:23S rRNA pseudouridine(1911/1915/1917) synthase RluD [Facilibium subflavum]|uniref:23S rRNA pseudouridine(1911/1915/1917) synthase RluD n=1 Tax=Facilibium subflavum TaxID=2219058 RepID=UPI000E65C890|nr:23S rRNA pseudouridine(1911/1915/1917) synthase RluD [Facilibium subflavum]